MAQEDVRLSGTFLDSAGNALANKTVTLFSEGTVTPALTTDTTDSAGEWDFTRTLSDLPGRYDVQLVTGTQTTAFFHETNSRFQNYRRVIPPQPSLPCLPIRLLQKQPRS